MNETNSNDSTIKVPTSHFTAANRALMCPNCDATGKIGDEECYYCEGTGTPSVPVVTVAANAAVADGEVDAPTKKRGRPRKDATDTAKPAKVGKSKTSKPKERSTSSTGGLTGKEIDVLRTLAKSPKHKGQLWDLCKAGSSILGAATKESPTGLQGKGFIKAEKLEGERQIRYTITAAGKKALEKADK